MEDMVNNWWANLRIPVFLLLWIYDMFFHVLILSILPRLLIEFKSNFIILPQNLFLSKSDLENVLMYLISTHVLVYSGKVEILDFKNWMSSICLLTLYYIQHICTHTHTSILFLFSEIQENELFLLTKKLYLL